MNEPKTAVEKIATFERLRDELKQEPAEPEVLEAMENYFAAQIARFKKQEAMGK